MARMLPAEVVFLGLALLTLGYTLNLYDIKLLLHILKIYFIYFVCMSVEVTDSLQESFSPSIMWALRLELGSSPLAADAITH